MDNGLSTGTKNYYAHGMDVTVDSNVPMLARGIDPKPQVLEFCKPLCTYWEEKLQRCESKLASIVKINPTKTCIYPMRDWTTCVEACVRISPLTLGLGATQNS
jgi:ubiquinol-cytochrome c reductase subunit 6